MRELNTYIDTIDRYDDNGDVVETPAQRAARLRAEAAAQAATNVTGTTASDTPAASGDTGTSSGGTAMPTKSGPIIETGMGPNPEDPFGGMGPPADTSITGDPLKPTPTPDKPPTPTPAPVTSSPTTTSTPAPATNGDPLYRLTSADVATLQTARPDVYQEFLRASSTADRNSPVFTQKGLDSFENYANYWYRNLGGYNGYNPGGATGPGGSGGDQAQQQGQDLITNLTNGFNQQMQQLQQQNQLVIDKLTQQLGTANDAATQNQNTLLGQISQMQTGFAQSQQDLIDQMNRAAAAQSQQFSSALKGMQDGMNGLVNGQAQSGQQSKKPNYGRALQRNKELNSGGLGSTMITGPGGVSGGMTLGFKSLLGA